MGFLSNFFKVQGKNLKNAANQALVAFDPEAATEAEIKTLEDSFNELLVRMGEAQGNLEREQREADAARSTYEKYMAAAEKLSAKGDTASSEEAEALGELVIVLETHVPEMEREEQEAKEAEEYLAELRKTAEVMRDKLLSARKSLDAAKKGMEKASLRKERAEIKAENAAAMAGLRDQTNALGEASKAMLEKAAKDKAEAAAMEAKTSLLSGSGKPSVLEKYLDAGATTSNASISDRLKSLKR